MNILKWLFSRKYRLFTNKISDVQMSMWEFEFKIAKARVLKEAARQDRERMLEAMQQISAHIAGEQDEEKKAAMEKERAQFEINKGHYERQMQMIDQQINGVPASGENPGEQGIMDTLRGLAELQLMYKDYRSKI